MTTKTPYTFRVGDVDHMEITARRGSAQRVPRAIAARSVLARVPQNVLRLGLGHAMPIDVRQAGVRVNMVTDVHGRLSRAAGVHVRTRSGRA